MMLFPEGGRRRVPERLRFVPFLVLGGSALLLDTRTAHGTPAVQFQSGFMRQGPGYDADAGLQALNALGAGQLLAAGTYRVQVTVNRHYFGVRELRFDSDAQGERLLPCLSPELLEQMGVRLPDLAAQTNAPAECVDLFTVVPGSEIAFDARQLQLTLSVPQIAMRRSAIGQVDPALWDHGINAAFINYQVSARQGSHRTAGRRNSDDLYLNSGINLGAWRLRSNQSLRQDEHGKREWARAYTYLQRDIPGTHANLTLGETFTGGEVFRSVPIRGLLVKSDLGMLSDMQQGYAPVIRGVAQSRAKLEVLQNGYPIYSTYVSAGPYAIDDLSTAGSGELQVVLTEDDGQVRRFIQPYSTISNLLREGVWQYSGALGRYNSAHGHDQPLLWQGTLAMGLGWGTSVYGGLLGSDFYRAASLGVARDLGSIGALAFDVTQSRADIDTLGVGSVQGMSYAARYGKAFATQTHLRFAGYRYSTEGYRDFDEAIQQRSNSAQWYGNRRSRLEASVHQRIGRDSSLSLTLSNQDYWGSRYEQRQYQFNFSSRYSNVSYNFYASQSLSNLRGTDRQFGVSVSMPLDWRHSSTANFDVLNHDKRYSQRASLSGSLDEHRLNYHLGLSNDQSRQQSASLALGYQTPYASVGAGLSQGSHYRSASLNASGSVLVHGEGVEFGSSLGETMALVEVPGIAGIGIQNASAARTNERGYALVPYLRPYRFNPVVLKTDDLGAEVEVDNGTLQVVPRRGAVIKASFAARKVNRLVLTVRSADGNPLPFGAQLSDAQGQVLGVVGQGGQVMLSVGEHRQTLDVRWGEDSAPRCSLTVDPQATPLDQGYRLQELTCA